MTSARLLGSTRRHISGGMVVMRILPALFVLVAGSAMVQPLRAAAPAATAAAAANAPKLIGKFEEWTAASHEESGQKVCYAFTRAARSVPELPGRAEVILTVTERPSGRDAVAYSAGFTFTQGAASVVQVDQTGLDFYTAQRNAFARDGRLAVAAFQKGSQALARSPGPRDVNVVDTFSLKGFSAAYAAITKACPAR